MQSIVADARHISRSLRTTLAAVKEGDPFGEIGDGHCLP
jgi:hypothetical protein